PVQPILLRLADLGETHLPISLMPSQEVLARANRQAHQPVLEGSVAAEAGQLLKRFKPYLLDNILHLAFAPGVATRRRENPRRILHDQRLETRHVPAQHGGDEFRVRLFHLPATMPNGPPGQKPKPGTSFPSFLRFSASTVCI